ncbi:retrotransposon protein, putative, ty1-copia subclass [Tanacetum coccineum]
MHRSLRIVLRVADTYDYLYKPCPDQPPETATAEEKAAWKAEYKKHSDVACIMLGKMSPALQRQSLNKDFGDFVRNFNMHCVGKTVSDLHALLIDYEKGLKDKVIPTPQVKLVPLPLTGHWKRNCPLYLEELRANKKKSEHSAAGNLFAIELFNLTHKLNSWVYDTGCGIHVCNTLQGFNAGKEKLAYGDQYLHMGNGAQAVVEAIGTFDLVLPSGLVLKLNNCYFAPSIVRGVVSFSCLLDLGFKHTVASNGISVSLNGVFYLVLLSVITCPYWQIACKSFNVKVFLESSNEESFDNANLVYFWEMTKKPFNRNIERATESTWDLIILSVRYGYVYLLKHKHEVFETFKVFKAEVELQLGKKIKALRSDRGGEYLSQDYGRSMFNLTTLPLSFWDYAYRIQLYGVVRRDVKRDSVIKSQNTRSVSVSLYSGRDCDLEDDHIDTLPSENTSEIPVEPESLGPPPELIPVHLAKWMLQTAFLNGRLDEESFEQTRRQASYSSLIQRFDEKSNGLDLFTIMMSHVYIAKASGVIWEKAYMKRVPYASAVGSIMYAVRCTRPDVAFAQNLVSRYQQNPGKLHWVAVKHILKFCDASWQCDKDDTKSQTGYVFVVNGGAVDWKSKKQTTIAMHATQSEYMAASEAAMEAVWHWKL